MLITLYSSRHAPLKFDGEQVLTKSFDGISFTAYLDSNHSFLILHLDTGNFLKYGVYNLTDPFLHKVLFSFCKLKTESREQVISPILIEFLEEVGQKVANDKYHFYATLSTWEE